MIEPVRGGADVAGVAAAAQLLHDFNTEYDEPTPAPRELAARLAERSMAIRSRCSWRATLGQVRLSVSR